MICWAASSRATDLIVHARLRLTRVHFAGPSTTAIPPEGPSADPSRRGTRSPLGTNTAQGVRMRFAWLDGDRASRYSRELPRPATANRRAWASAPPPHWPSIRWSLALRSTGEAGIPSQPLRAKPESTPDEDHNTDDPHVLTDKGAAMLHALRRVLLRRWRFCLPCASSAAAECAWVL